MSSVRFVGLARQSKQGPPPRSAELARLWLSAFFQLFGKRAALTLDHGLVAAGIAAAIGSAVFAGYMVTHENEPPVFGGVEYLKLFAQPVSSKFRRMTIGSGGGGAGAFDYIATGSIRHGGALAAGGRVHAVPKAAAVAKLQAVLPDSLVEGYVLRFVHKGLAIVQGSKGSFAVAPGVALPDAGRVLSIEKRGSRWVVVTVKGLIAEPTF